MWVGWKLFFENSLSIIQGNAQRVSEDAHYSWAKKKKF